jgi:hypothetical protein
MEPLMGSSEPETVLKGLIELANLQRRRVLALFADEMKTGFINVHLDRAMNLYAKALLSIQKMRFDLGLDERKHEVSWAEAAERRAEEQRNIYEAYTEAEKILEKRLGPVGTRVPGFDKEAN